MEISHVRQRVMLASIKARERSQERRTHADRTALAYQTFLKDVATPVTRQLANVLKAEGHGVTVFTPGDGLRLALDRSRDDYVELALDGTGDTPYALARVSRTRGSKTSIEDRPIALGKSPAELTEEDVLTAMLDAIEPWLER